LVYLLIFPETNHPFFNLPPWFQENGWSRPWKPVLADHCLLRSKPHKIKTWLFILLNPNLYIRRPGGKLDNAARGCDVKHAISYCLDRLVDMA